MPDCTGAVYAVVWNAHGDALGLWRQNSDGTVTLANRYGYSSWGAPTTTTVNGYGDLAFPFLYVGAAGVMWDRPTGLLDMGARVYSPLLGRFLQPDPSGAEAAPYVYAGDNPITNADPSGTFTLDIPGFIMSGLRVTIPGLPNLLPFLPPMGPQELWDCLFDYAGCITDLQTGAEADLFTHYFYRSRNDLTDGPGDALRHCTWQCLLTIEVGPREAMKFGNDHEADELESAASHTMDFRNNAIARSLGSQLGWVRAYWAQPFTMLALAGLTCLHADLTHRLWVRSGSNHTGNYVVPSP